MEITFPIHIATDFFVDVNVGSAELFYDDPALASGPFCVEYRNGHTTGYATEDEACAVQRAWRLAHNRHPMTAEPLVLNALTDIQFKTLDWALTVLIEQTAENAHGYQPDQAVEEICGLRSLVELLPLCDLHDRLANQCEELRREHQVRLDAVLAEETSTLVVPTKLFRQIVGLADEAVTSRETQPDDDDTEEMSAAHRDTVIEAEAYLRSLS